MPSLVVSTSTSEVEAYPIVLSASSDYPEKASQRTRQLTHVCPGVTSSEISKETPDKRDSEEEGNLLMDLLILFFLS